VIARAATLLIALALAALAYAEPDAPALRTSAARALFQAGKSAYEAGHFEEALHEFNEGYRLSPRPEFLLNIAQTYNKLGRADEAMKFYEDFLAADPESPFAPTARANLATLKRQRTGTPPAVTPEPARTPAPRALVTAPPPRRSRTWHLAWALPVAAVVITATALGVYFGTRGPSCDPRTCIDLSHAP
jgi:tetratricopeptide (TPR) repeat protein